MDEDLISVFSDDQGFILVCETSVRRNDGYEDIERIDFGTPIEFAHWEEQNLAILDTDGSWHTIAVEPGLVAGPADGNL